MDRNIHQLTNPLVSVIIPVYNAVGFLNRAIASILGQTWRNWELIIVDDGSTDDSYKIAQGYAGPNIKVLRQENKGAGAARNRGLQIAAGEYIQFLDADDYLSANKIEVQLRELQHAPPNSLAFCSHKDMPTGTSPYRFTLPSLFSPYELLLKLYGPDNSFSIITLHSWLIPRTCIAKAGKWNESLSVDDDGEYFCRIVLASQHILYVPDTFAYYRKHQTAKNLSARVNLKAMKSQFRASELKYQHLLDAFPGDQQIHEVMAYQFMTNAFRFYPSFPELVRKTLKLIRQTGAKKPPLPSMGGRVANLIRDIFGWKIVRHLQTIKRRIT